MATSLLGDGLWVCTVHSGEDIQALGTGAVGGTLCKRTAGRLIYMITLPLVNYERDEEGRI